MEELEKLEDEIKNKKKVAALIMKLRNLKGKDFADRFRQFISDEVMSEMNWSGQDEKKELRCMKIFDRILWKLWSEKEFHHEYVAKVRDELKRGNARLLKKRS